MTRRRATWDRLEVVADSPQQLQRVVGLLAGSQQRLIITDKNTVEVAHEALLSEWKLLNTWIAENLENIRLSCSLEEDCQEWVQRFNKSDDALLTGANLAVISEWVNKTQPRLTPLESEFLHKSLERRDRQNQAELEQAKKLQREAEAKAKAESQRTRFAITSAILVAVCGGLGSFAWQISTKNSLKDKIASGALIASPELLFQTGNQLDAMIASVQALKQFQDLGIDNANVLNRLKLVMDKVQEHNRLEGHTDSVTSVSVSPTENLIVSGSKDKTVRLWNLNGTLVKTAFGSDNKTLISASEDNTIRIWKWKNDPKDRQSMIFLTEFANTPYRVKFSPNNQIIAATSVDGTIQLWKGKVDKWTPLKLLGKHSEKITDLSFSPDSRMIVTASRDTTLRVWSLDSHYETSSETNTAGLLTKGCHWLSDYLSSNDNAGKKYLDIREICQNFKN